MLQDRTSTYNYLRMPDETNGDISLPGRCGYVQRYLWRRCDDRALLRRQARDKTFRQALLQVWAGSVCSGCSPLLLCNGGGIDGTRDLSEK